MANVETGASLYQKKHLYLYDILTSCANLLTQAHEDTHNNSYLELAGFARNALDVVREELIAFELTATTTLQ